MYYWNRANFEGLAELSIALAEDPWLSSLAEYCRYREQGLRDQAFAALDAFLAKARTWEPEAARSACQTILELHARTPEAHQFLAYPLLDRFVFPTLDDWLKDFPESQTAVRWLGILRSDRALLERALELALLDLPVRRRLVELILSDVDYSTHHLVESRLLGELDVTKRSLAQAREIVEASPDTEALVGILKEIEHYEALLRDWESFCHGREGTFPEWCARRGRPYRWPTIIYYEK